MKTPLDYYKKHKDQYQIQVKNLKKRIALYSMLRLLVFLITALGMYLCFGQWGLMALIGVSGIILFVFLLSKHTDVKRQRDFNKALVAINEDEIAITSGNFHSRPDGMEFQDPSHFYSLDIDLFGRGSFFQFVNRTTIKEGAQKLANALKANNINHINKRQQAIKELSSKPKWRQYYSASSHMVAIETPAKDIIYWLHNHIVLYLKSCLGCR